jgi:ATP-dependent helicase HrpB
MSSIFPIHTILPNLKTALNTHNQIILQADPGAGKTTVVPLELLNDQWLKGQKIVMLEPRRLAARAAAERMAQTLGERVGRTVGYRMRGEAKVSNATRIEVVTEGVLTRMLQNDPALEGVGLVIFDEFHERSIHADLSLALTLQAQEVFRDDLKILVMSATLQKEALQGILPDAPYIYSEGRSFPVEMRYLDIKSPLPGPRGIAEAAAKTALEVLGKEEGSLLVFLPGAAEIRKAESWLTERAGEDVIVAPLYGAMEGAAQRKAIEPAPEGKRKVVLATNIAETSLTIEGVRVVIDGGLERRVRYDANLGMDRYETGFISRDSATQRAGRAGRTAPGVCYRLWHEIHALAPHRPPEISTADLTPLVLELALWGAEPEELRFIDQPPGHAIESARTLLRDLRMLDANGAPTFHGKEVLALGLHPRLGHMLLEAKEMGLGYEAVLLALLWTERPLKNAPEDLSLQMERLHAVMNYERRIRKLADRLMARAGIRPRDPQSGKAGVLTALAYPGRIARRREGGEESYLTASGRGVRLKKESALARSPWLAVAEVGGSGRESTIHSAARLTEEELVGLFGERFERTERVLWNERAERVEARRVVKLGAIEIESEPIRNPDGANVARALLEGIRQKGLEVLPWKKKSRSLLRRVRFIRRHMPEAVPDTEDDTLLKGLEDWLLPHIDGMCDLKALQRLDMTMILTNMTGWEAMRSVDELAPERLDVPSGSKIAVDYTDPDNPVLPVRLQEVFGWIETPRILQGGVPLTLHLLSPARRPLAVTRDLATFWRNVYPDVRKEMRGRYPKHYWPEDPFTATATKKTKKGMEK